MGSEQSLGVVRALRPGPQALETPSLSSTQGAEGKRVGSLQPLVKYRTKAPPTAFLVGCKASISPRWPWPAPSSLTSPPSSAETSRKRGGRPPRGLLSSALSRSASTGRTPCGRRVPRRPRGRPTLPPIWRGSWPSSVLWFAATCRRCSGRCTPLMRPMSSRLGRPICVPSTAQWPGASRSSHTTPAAASSSTCCWTGPPTSTAGEALAGGRGVGRGQGGAGTARARSLQEPALKGTGHLFLPGRVLAVRHPRSEIREPFDILSSPSQTLVLSLSGSRSWKALRAGLLPRR